MINIIISKYKILVEIQADSMVLPSIDSIKLINHMLSPITTTTDKFVAKLTDDLPLPDSLSTLKLINLRQALGFFDEPLVADIIYYQQLNNYYSTHNFCGICGTQTVHNTNNKFVSCPSCKIEVYPHIAPCIVVRIHKAKQILMARGINFLPGAWGLIAGFVEIGETLEEAVKREVKEEVNLEISDIKYWNSQPWPFPNNTLMVGFTAMYKSGTIAVAPDEIEEAGFYGKNNLPGLPTTNYSLSSRMINEYLIKLD
jgi:NAD+ diphosphatase